VKLSLSTSVQLTQEEAVLIVDAVDSRQPRLQEVTLEQPHPSLPGKS
jgi:hypothetical protein